MVLVLRQIPVDCKTSAVVKKGTRKKKPCHLGGVTGIGSVTILYEGNCKFDTAVEKW